MHPLLDFCESQREWLLDLISRLVHAESPTGDRAALDRCARILHDESAAAGGRVTRLPGADAGDHLLAEFGCSEEQVLLLGHYDTVWPVGQLSRMPFRQEGGRLFGPGVYDMKAGLAIGLLALRAVAETAFTQPPRVSFLMTSDEETGSHSSRGTIEDEARRSRAVFVLEPAMADGRVKTSRKGVGVYELHVTGTSAHAGVEPGKGASAIHELASLVTKVVALQDPSRGVSVNVGLIDGGSRSNVVADHARAEIDVRLPTRADADRIAHAFETLSVTTPGTTLRVSGRINRYPMERTAGVVALFERAREIAGAIGFELGEGSTGGASDGNFTAALGIPTLDGLGAVGDGAHALREHVIIDELPRRAALLAGLILAVAEP